LFAEATLERATVLSADDELTSEMFKPSASTTHSSQTNWLFRLKACEDKAAAFKRSPGLASVPQIRDVADVLQRLKNGIDHFSSCIGVFDFGLKYKDVAFKYGLHGLFLFCQWAMDQQKFHQAMVSDRVERYKQICMLCKRHPDTPEMPSSWPPPPPPPEQVEE
jgi:hypothetical protein